MRTLLLSLLLASIPAQATVNAYLDRYTVTEGNSIRLTLESDQAGGLSPDLSPLHKEFQILGSKKMSITSNANDTRQTSARWQVLLRPKRPGSVKLPAIQVGAESSSEMEVMVERADRSRNYAANAQATLELMASSSVLYQNSQMVLTLRLTDNLALPAANVLKPPVLANATVLPFGNASQRQSVRRGQVFNLMEQKYLVFPEAAGPLKVPAYTLTLAGQTNTPRQVSSEPLAVEVRPAAAQQSRGFWLPASQLSLTDSLQGTTTLTVGESVERTLTLTAHGIRADALPALMPLKNELATIDIIDIQRSERQDNQGLISTRAETVRITPHERGEITLPEITLPWWDTRQDRSQTITLASQQITALPAPTQQASDNSAAGNEGTAAEQASSTGQSWLYLFGALLAAAAAAAFWLIRKRRQQSQDDGLPIDHHAEQEANAFDTLAMACQQPDPFLGQQALVLWAQEFWSGLPVNNSADVAQLAGSEAFELLVEDLEQHMAGGSEEWQGDLLLQAVSALRGN